MQGDPRLAWTTDLSEPLRDRQSTIDLAHLALATPSMVRSWFGPALVIAAATLYLSLDLVHGDADWLAIATEPRLWWQVISRGVPRCGPSDSPRRRWCG
jgi:hypothetical protein